MRLESISRQLETSVRDDNTEGETSSSDKFTQSHVQLGVDWENAIAEIRSKEGFESFLKPKSFDQLAPITREGPVVILSLGPRQCDALVVVSDENAGVYTFPIQLHNFSYQKAKSLLKQLKHLLFSKHLAARNTRKAKRVPFVAGNEVSLPAILRELWLDVVKPIIDGLGYQPRDTGLPHIWWYPMGNFSFLPIHAAGLYDTDKPGHKLSDYAVSSYIPTLSALLDQEQDAPEDFKLLAVAQPNAPDAPPIPNTEDEVQKIYMFAQNIDITPVIREDATVENVLRGMEESNWVHLACHGQQDTKEPMKSGLLLQDGTLELRRLVEKPLPKADFAFLSACQTATGDETVAEESLHLAAGMLFSGYKGVIATMWSIMDDVAPQVAEDVYREMLKDGKPNRKAAAYALHNAVKRLREESKQDFLSWVPFIHIGR